jgi:xylan 1,4-beta-xylosidase
MEIVVDGFKIVKIENPGNKYEEGYIMEKEMNKTERPAASTGTREFRYRNPITQDPGISMRDHCIVKAGELWYCTGTSHPIWSGKNPGVRLLVSDDLLNWRHHSWVIDAKRLLEDCPYNGRFWAPEIHFIKGAYYLTVNSGRVTDDDPKGMKTHSIWLFSAPEITGPYALLNGPLTDRYNNDATLFEDDDGKTYLYCSGNGLFQAEIDLRTGRLIGTIEKFLDKKEPGYPDWIVGGIEGPFVVKRSGAYFMFFSSWTRGYELGLLRARNPLGPWELVDPEPIFGTRKRKYRPELAIEGGYDRLVFSDTPDPYCETGHNALFEGPDGRLWTSCHYMLCDQGSEFRAHLPQLGIEPLEFRDGRFYINGPTWTPQLIRY